MSIDICPDFGDIVSELTAENDKLNARIAELEELVDKLIEVGGEMSDQSYWHEIKWQALVKDWKEREE